MLAAATLGALGSAWLEEPLVAAHLEPMAVEPSVSPPSTHPGLESAMAQRAPEASPVVLRAPEAPAAHGGFIPKPSAQHRPPVAVAYQFMAPVYSRPSRDSLLVGRVRRGTAIPAPSAVGKRCGSGAWYRLGPKAYVCSAEGFHYRAREPFFVDQRLPSLDRNIPYRYAAVQRLGAPRYLEVPTPDEVAAIAGALHAGDGPPRLEIVDRYLDGEFFIAIDRREERESGRFVRTVRGRWLHEDDVREVEPSSLVGEELGGAAELPMAFVPAGEAAALHRVDSRGLAEHAGIAEPYARARVTGEIEASGETHLRIQGGLSLRRADVRLATKIAPPAEIEPGERWIHVDLDEQVLVAYEGEEPRYVTLVASGKPGWETPTGLHRIANKLAVFTMKGDDPQEGYYEVEDVPWTMFYDGGYALHGAYWHDAFGSPRSHGCTNLSPADARYVYAFTSPDVPEGWQGRVYAKGSWIYLTQSAEAEPAR